ncbi:PREDICTED: uncharacterized protein LOC109462211 [Branchiostoma belcheri]|uniref:Uncharacterized protein LOC109462211 n=1 Tax=Branchiostoma belcheri TaxID=7741 RepID=A0A6P4XUJ5_BRABE|nr:PREDICTED: uncharacterized protein LOC109462211 [Branchiostoma belcheri]
MSTVSRFPPLQVSSVKEMDKIRPRSHEIPRQSQQDGQSSDKPRPKSQELPLIRGASRAGWRTAKSRVASKTRTDHDSALSLKPPPGHTGRTPSPGLRPRAGWEKQDGARTPSEEMDDLNRSSRNRFYRTAAMATRSQTLLDISRHLVPPIAGQNQRRESDFQETKTTEMKSEAVDEKYGWQSTDNVTLTSSTVRLTQEAVSLTVRDLYSPLVNDDVCEDSNNREETWDYSSMRLNKIQQPGGVEVVNSTLGDKISRGDDKGREQIEHRSLIHLNQKHGKETFVSTLVGTRRNSRKDGDDQEERQDKSHNTSARESPEDVYLSAGLSYGYKLRNEISRWGNQDSSRFSHSLKLLNRIESGIGSMLGGKTLQSAECEEKLQRETENSLPNLQISENASEDPLASDNTLTRTRMNEGKEDENSEGKGQIFTSHGRDETDSNLATTNTPTREYTKPARNANSWCQTSYGDYYVTTLEEKRQPNPTQGRQKNGKTLVSGELHTYEDYFISLDSRSKFKRV